VSLLPVEEVWAQEEPEFYLIQSPLIFKAKETFSFEIYARATGNEDLVLKLKVIEPTDINISPVERK